MSGLRDAQRFARELLPHVPNAGVFVFDADTRMCFADGDVLRRQGFTPEHVIGRRAGGVLPEEV